MSFRTLTSTALITPPFSLGLHGAVALAVGQRTCENGIRVAPPTLDLVRGQAARAAAVTQRARVDC
jgi:hypothetical protein